MTASRPIAPATYERLLALNNEHAEELSALDPASFDELVTKAVFARAVETDAFIIALDRDADYASPNFRWFTERYARFIYIDRVVVSASARGRGHARLLYDELFRAARAGGFERVVCEVNHRPPNTSSDAFHERLGFREVGRAAIHDGAKEVRYLERLL